MRQDLVELDRGGSLRDGDVAAVGQLGSAGAAWAQVQEEVPFEEEAGPDLDLGVASDRQPLVLDGERHRGGVAFRLDLDDLAHVDAGDPDRSGLAKGCGVLEGRGQGVPRVAPWQLLGVGEEGKDRQEDDQGQSPPRRVRTAVPAAPDTRIKARIGRGRCR